MIKPLQLKVWGGKKRKKGSMILDALGESRYDFSISRLDILTGFMDHIPQTYPVLLFAGKSATDEVADILSRNEINFVPYTNIKDYSVIRRMSFVGEIALLIPTQEFVYAANGLATFEKAFVDLY